jgi:hypothetical protein
MMDSAKRIFSCNSFSGKLFAAALAAFAASGAHAAEWDMEDPLFFEGGGDLTLRAGASAGSDLFDAGLQARYGINELFALSIAANYQQDFHSDADGFSDIGIQLAYRASEGRVVADVLAGVNFGGRAAPEWLNTVYMAGVKIGHSWDSWTLAGTFKASWIFDDNYGMSFADLMPEVYFRLSDSWRLGADITFRRATAPAFDREWIGLKLARQYGRTQYVGFAQYEFEEGDFRLGARTNVIF